MRILPRSAKGTWLLAGAAWVAGCAAVWWLIRAVPWASWTVPEPSGLIFRLQTDELVTFTLRFYPCGDIVYPSPPPPPPPGGPFRVWDTRSGRLLEAYAPDDETAARFNPPLPDNPPGTGFEAISRDRSVLAASINTGGVLSEIGVWDAHSLRRLGRIRLPADIQRVYCDVNSAGTILAASLTDSAGNDVGVICWETATGRELFRVPDTNQLVLSPDGSTLLTIGDPTRGDDGVEYQLSVWDVNTGRQRFALDLTCDGFILNRHSALISPNGRTIAAPTGTGPVDPLGNLARRLGFAWPFGKLATGECMTLFDAETGRELGAVSGEFDNAVWSPDSRLLATLDENRHLVRVWDVPPRKPLTWFALAAAVLALPLAWLARRRVRRMRSLAGITP